VRPAVCLIVAVAENGVIGSGNELPWHIPADLQHFKQLTMGKPVILGRKTFESIGRPLPGRHFIVLTKNISWHHEGVLTAQSSDEALRIAENIAAKLAVDEIMVAGGAELYNLLLDRADRIYRTWIHLMPSGDAHFPLLGPEWKVVSEERPSQVEPEICFQRLEKCG
jgi:dihydrofolate reductase